jgi:hypothetical protein
MNPNNNYICILNSKAINIYLLNMKFVKRISIHQLIQNLAINNNNNMCVSSHDKFYVNNIEKNCLNHAI